MFRLEGLLASGIFAQSLVRSFRSGSHQQLVSRQADKSDVEFDKRDNDGVRGLKERRLVV
jgi:hypothetical protein